jgi:arginyl-tRNA synthetase
MNLLQRLKQTFEPAIATLGIDPAPYAAMLKPTQDPKHGDYQANCAMALAKAVGDGRKPQEIAQALAKALDLGDWLESPEVAGPGFINLRLKNKWLAVQLQAMAADERLGVTPAAKPRTFVIDFSSPNVAKPLHVGHLRTTIIGDALARLLTFLGHRVIRDNHLGDWGLQFGMLIYGYKNFLDPEGLKANPLRELLRLYQHVRSLTRGTEGEEGEEILTPEEQAHLRACREETAKLQAGDPENRALWEKMIGWSMPAITPLYERMDISFDVQHGESFYEPMLPGVAEDLLAKHIARISKGAVTVFMEDRPPERELDEEELKKIPKAIVRKQDGAFTYMTSDLATIRYRAGEWQPDALLYVVGAPQSQHFALLFHTARRWGYADVEFQHIVFGSVLGSDRKMLSTRNGGAEELSDLLDMAVVRGAETYAQSLQERRERGEEVPDLTDQEKQAIAEAVGIGAVKYADLSQNRTSDYVFSWEKMLATDGNTATYMQYAYARSRSVFRKENIDPEPYRTNPPAVQLVHPLERALGVQLLRFQEVLEAAALDYKPNLITSYLWDLAKSFSSFYQHRDCSVLKAPTPELRASRLLLCDLTGRVIHKGLELLGIRTIERM